MCPMKDGDINTQKFSQPEEAYDWSSCVTFCNSDRLYALSIVVKSYNQ